MQYQNQQTIKIFMYKHPPLQVIGQKTDPFIS